MFLDTLMADPPPQCLVWLPLMHRLAHVENGKWNILFKTSVRAGLSVDQVHWYAVLSQ